MRAFSGSRRQVGVAIIVFSALTAATAPTAASAVSPRDPEVPLSANVVAGPRNATRTADEVPRKSIDIQLALRLRNRAQLDDLIRQASTPGSPGYGRHLTPTEFGARFGPTAREVSQATSFLRANGLRVVAAAAGSTLVDALGSVDAVQRALHTTIGRYQEPTGRQFFANDTAPQLPASLASIVIGVLGLDNRYQQHHSTIQPQSCCAPSPYTPTQIRTAYHLDAAPLSGLTGSGQALGLLELDDFQQANIDAYDAAYNLPTLTPQRWVVDHGPSISSGGEIEVELDIELVHAVAPGAAITVFEGPNDTLGMNDAYACMVNPDGGTFDGPCPNLGSPLTMSNSSSWGLCEPLQGLDEATALDGLFAEAAMQGQTFYAASGDTGAYDCPSDSSTLSVDSPASDPYVTGVGGTKLQLNADNTIYNETAWPAEPRPNLGSGGGLSIYWPKPAWQKGPGSMVTAEDFRQVPDVSLNADPTTGYSIYTCTSGSSVCNGAGARLRALGGTSAGAPAWAAFTAIYNQYAAAQGKPKLGFANPMIYTLGHWVQPLAPFNDVTIGDNKEGFPAGYEAGPGYDMVTGWGSLRAADFALDATTDASGGSPKPGPNNRWYGTQGPGSTRARSRLLY